MYILTTMYNMDHWQLKFLEINRAEDDRFVFVLGLSDVLVSGMDRNASSFEVWYWVWLYQSSKMFW